MTDLPFTLTPDNPSLQPMGLIVLQADETLEPEFQRHFVGHPSPIYVSRIPSQDAVTPEALTAMEQDLPAAARLLPKARPFSVVGYGCTSASTLIGSERVAEMIKRGCSTAEVTNPLRAAAAVAQHLGVSKLALISPYIEEVNEPLRQAFADRGLSTDVFGSFGQSDEATVVRISTRSVIEAAVRLGATKDVEGVFLSCTNLRTYDAVPEIEARTGKPVLSSNSALATHMKWLSDRSNERQVTRI